TIVSSVSERTRPPRQDSSGIQILGPVSSANAAVLSSDAVQFVAGLQREFNERRKSLLFDRRERQVELDQGRLPDFLSQTASIRSHDWRVAKMPRDLTDRRVEITGPVDRKMVINALNSGASCFMADFEDSHSPTWTGTLDGQVNVHDAVMGTI